jgi:hypothetical protein
MLAKFVVHTPLLNSFFLQFLNSAQYFWDFTFSVLNYALALGFAETFAGVILLCVLLPLQDAPCS